jgi:hypothetical protein
VVTGERKIFTVVPAAVPASYDVLDVAGEERHHLLRRGRSSLEKGNANLMSVYKPVFSPPFIPIQKYKFGGCTLSGSGCQQSKMNDTMIVFLILSSYSFLILVPIENRTKGHLSPGRLLERCKIQFRSENLCKRPPFSG